MIHLKPVNNSTATPKIQSIYQDVRDILEIDTIPLIFQYIANYEDYLEFLWHRVKTNLTSKDFQETRIQLEQFTTSAVSLIYTPSESIQLLIAQLPPREKADVIKTVKTLSKLNVELLLMSVGIREGIKGALSQTHFKREFADEKLSDEIFKEVVKGTISQDTNTESLRTIGMMLATIPRTNALALSYYKDFFLHVALEMDALVKEESYLKTRVGLEQLTHIALSTFKKSFGTSYKELALFAGKKPYFDELLYLLYETFPTHYPRMVVTSGVMKKVLKAG